MIFRNFSVERSARAACWIAGGALALCAVCSLWWRAVHDVPILVYMARLMSVCGAVPYRDIFDMNLPGTFMMYRGLAALFGISDYGLRAADLAVISGVLAALFLGLRRWGGAVAWLGVGVVGLRIFSGTWAFALQRELLALLPFGLLFAWGMRAERCRGWHGIGAGLLLAWLASIKPQLVLLGLPLWGLLVTVCDGWKTKAWFLFSTGVFFCLPLLSVGGWLVQQQAWGRFWEVARYWTLYGEMNFAHEVVPRSERVREMFAGGTRMLFSAYTGGAALALSLGYRSQRLSLRHLICWVALLAAAVLVPCLSGQFWGYHRLPYFVIALSATGFLLSAKEGAERRLGLAAGVCVALAWSVFAVPKCAREAFGAGAVQTEKHGVPDAVADYLREHLRAEDRVQPMGWTGGAVHAMLLADARPATRFLYTFHFYHHVRSPLIQELRSEFLHALRVSPPRYLLETVGEPFPTGVGTEERFVELDTWKAERYHVVKDGSHFQIWEVNGHE